MSPELLMRRRQNATYLTRSVEFTCPTRLLPWEARLLRPAATFPGCVKTPPRYGMAPTPRIVIPAEAGIQGRGGAKRTCFPALPHLDSRFRGNDGVGGGNDVIDVIGTSSLGRFDTACFAGMRDLESWPLFCV